MGNKLIFFKYSISFLCFFSNFSYSVDLIDDCYGIYWDANKECAVALQSRCEGNGYNDLYFCVSTITSSNLRQFYSSLPGKLKLMRGNLTTLCEKYGMLRLEYDASFLVGYELNYLYFEDAAKDGYLYAMKILATSSDYFSVSDIRRKKSIYYSLLYNYRLNQKVPAYIEMKKIRGENLKHLTKEEYFEIAEEFLGSVKSVDFTKCSDY